MATMSTDNLTRRFAVACGVLSQYVRTNERPPPSFVQLGAAQEGNANAQQLTIFYGGRVLVLDACPPEKAAELIRLAAAAQVGALEPALVDMPIARKASLRRFLAKRKDRATEAAGAPYNRKDGEPEPEPAAKKGKREEDSSWLALGSLGDMHAR
ncbi:protein TIFY 11a-like [Phragmites australis]|uniref:protein TIFY 11a-like n=1 Tax=Phragmites australis TaxID=29695 RepID=UPI002D784FD6|nr:protein TIFY 11a-like [Phragmites australis]